jgi:hypothetical protein
MIRKVAKGDNSCVFCSGASKNEESSSCCDASKEDDSSCSCDKEETKED